MANDDQQFGENVQRLRKVAGLSQAELAAAMTDEGFPMQQQTVLKLEKGQRPMRLAEAVALARILKAKVEELVHLGYTDEELEVIRLDRMLSDRYFALAAAAQSFVVHRNRLEAALGGRDPGGWIMPSHQRLLEASIDEILESLTSAAAAKRLGLIQWSHVDE
jgi:transcriptional regulator with XRE-family HTH domain